MKLTALTCLLIVSTSGPALAEDCAATFSARLADAKKALVERDAFIEKHQPEYAAAGWFVDHCRFLTELEVTVRKLDDANTFVCDPKAKGRPKKLTAELVANFSATPMASEFQSQAYFGDNHRCIDQDRAHGAALAGLDELTPLQELEFLCVNDVTEKCVKARERIAVLRAQGHE